MRPPADDASAALRWNRARTGALGFAAFTIAGLAALFWAGPRQGQGALLGELHAGFLALAVASALFDVVMGAVRYQIFLRRIRPGTSLRLPLRADLAGRFLGAVTPSQSGGGPAQVFVLQRGGVPVPLSLSFLGINLCWELLFFVVAGSWAAWTPRVHFSAGVHHAIQYGIAASAAGLLCLLLLLLRPDLLSRPLRRVADRAAAAGARPSLAVRAARLLADSSTQYREACRQFVR